MLDHLPAPNRVHIKDHLHKVEVTLLRQEHRQEVTLLRQDQVRVTAEVHPVVQEVLVQLVVVVLRVKNKCNLSFRISYL